MSETENSPARTATSQQDSMDESLDEALNALEGMLENRHVVPEPPQDDGVSVQGREDDIPDPDHFELEAESLPVLNQVVIPGIAPEAEPATAADMDETGEIDADLEEPMEQPDEEFADAMVAPPPHDDLVARLVNEVDIIVETSVEEAMVEAKKELMARLKTHLDIVLPEIMEELFRRCEDRQG